MSNLFCKSFSQILMLLMIPLFVSAQKNIKPNVIFILADDVGYGDFGCLGNLWIKTPNIDRLHDESVRFTDFHVGTTCAPSRAGLLSGQYSNKVGVWHTIKGREIMSAGVRTIAQALKGNGYYTAIFGKWHLGDNYPFRPQDKGFDEVLVHKGGGVGQAPDYWNNDYFNDTYFHNGKPEKFVGYCTDVWFRNAIQFIEREKDHPFFCYLSLNAAHGPYHVESKYSEQYEENENIPNPHFYGMISNIDENVGILKRKIKELGIEDNTILIFMTDNGTAGGAKFDKQGKLIAGYNAGMRGKKGSPYDGGHRVPFFLHWPGGHFENKDIDNITSYVDFMPTILELCGITPLSSDLDGKSLVPLLRGNSEDWPHRYLIVDTQRKEFLIKYRLACIMDDQWRLLMIEGRTELYNIKVDEGEINNVAVAHPDILQKMKQAYEKWWSETSVNQDKYNRIIIGSPHAADVTLSSHDCHSVGGIPAWNQEMVRAGLYEKRGFWALEVVRKGDYTIELRRWPKESGLAINEPAPPGNSIPNGKAYKVGVVMNYRQASITIGDRKLTQQIKSNSTGIKFKVSLSKGPINLYAGFTDKDGKENNAYYVYVSKIN